MTIREAGADLRAGRLSSAELVEDALRRIERLNPQLNAFITVTAELARGQARKLDHELSSGVDRGPLHGIPIAHKDLIATRGIRTTSGSKLFAENVPDYDAVVAQKLDSAGAVLVGKTGLHECAYGITSNNPHFGAIRNPWDTSCIPGGSSGGSGVAVATGMVFMATGTDTGGSIRIPASFCGTAGLKPTYGRVSRTGVQPLGFSLDHIGPLARTVEDTAIAFRAMAENVTSALASGPLRIGFPENFYLEQVDSEVRSAVEKAARESGQLGAHVVPVRVPDIEVVNQTSLIILLSEAAAAYTPFLERREDFGDDVLALLDQGRMIPAPTYVNAQRQRKLILSEFRKLFSQIDLLYTPTSPIPPARIGQMEIEIDGATVNVRMATTRFVRAFNLLGYPALSIPCGFTASGLPIGLQVVARPFEDERLLDWGCKLEQALPRPAFQVN